MNNISLDNCSKKDIIEFNWYNALRRNIGNDYCLIKTNDKYKEYIDAINCIRKNIHKKRRQSLMLQVFKYAYYAIWMLIAYIGINKIDYDSRWQPLIGISTLLLMIILCLSIPFLLQLLFPFWEEINKKCEEANPTISDIIENYNTFITQKILQGSEQAKALMALKMRYDGYIEPVSLINIKNEYPYRAYRNIEEVMMVMILADLLCGIQCYNKDVYLHYKREVNNVYYTKESELIACDNIDIFDKFVMNKIPTIRLIK